MEPEQIRPTPPNLDERKDCTRLDRQTWRNWFLFVGVALLTTIGLGTAVLTVGGERIQGLWPWAKTDRVLLAGLSVAILLFAGYLTQQQRQLVQLRRALLQASQEATERMRRTYDRLVALLNVSRVLATETNAQTVFDSITETCLATFDCEQATLLLLDSQSGRLEVASVSGHDDTASALALPQTVGRSLSGWVARERRPLVLGKEVDLNRYPGLQLEPPIPTRAMVAPIVMRGDLVGVLSVSSSSPVADYNEEDLQALLLFAESVGICCRHAEQTNWMRQTIQRLDQALQERGGDDTRRAA